MVKISVPAKLALFGEYAVTRGAPGIATALSKRFELTFTKSTVLELVDLGSQERLKLHGQNYQGHFLELAANVITSRDLLPGLYQFFRDWDLREGLGSSSALVAALEAVPKYTGLEEVWQRARLSLREHQSPKASGLDVAAQLWGGSVVLERDKIRLLAMEPPINLIVLHTGQKASTPELLKREHPEELLVKLGSSAREFCSRGNWLQAIEDHYAVLLKMDVVPDFVQSWRDEWKKRGWIQALKTVGAGGGDALLVLCTEEHRQTVIADAQAKGAWLNTCTWNAQGIIKTEVAGNL